MTLENNNGDIDHVYGHEVPGPLGRIGLLVKALHRELEDNPPAEKR